MDYNTLYMGPLLRLKKMDPQPIYPMIEYTVYEACLWSKDDLDPKQTIDMPDWGFDADEEQIRYREIEGDWYFCLAPFFNHTAPKEAVRSVLGEFGFLDDRQMGILGNMINYAHNDPSGLDGHNGYLIAEKLFVFLSLLIPRVKRDDLMDALADLVIWEHTL